MPVLILWSDLPEVLKVLLAAMATIATGATDVFRWKESYPCFTNVSESARSRA